MAYTPKDWVTGEVITEQALDHIEQGIASVVLHVAHDANTGNLDKTWQEIHDAFVGGSVVVIHFNDHMKFVTSVSSEGGSYSLYAIATASIEDHYVASSADGYPTIDFG